MRRPRYPACCWCLWASSLSLPGCSEDPPTPERVPVVLAAIDGPDWVDPLFAERLQSSAAFRPVPTPSENETNTSAEASIAIQEFAAGEVPVVRLDIEIDSLPPSVGAGSLDAHIEIERRDHTVDLARDVPIALARAIEVLDAKVALLRDEESVVGRLLADPDPELRIMAIQWVTRSGRRDLLDPVVQRLADPDPRVAAEALDCLGSLGAPEHAGPMVASARLSDRNHTGHLYMALGALGGAQAQGFLDFAARNEDDPDLASLAQKSLTQALVGPPKPAHATTGSIARGHR